MYTNWKIPIAHSNQDDAHEILAKQSKNPCLKKDTG